LLTHSYIDQEYCLLTRPLAGPLGHRVISLSREKLFSTASGPALGAHISS